MAITRSQSSGVDVGELLPQEHSHVVVEDIEPAVPLDRRLDHGPAVVLVGDVCLKDAGLTAFRGDQLEGLLRVIGVDIHEQDLRTFTGEQDRCRLAVADTWARLSPRRSQWRPSPPVALADHSR